MAKVYEDRVTVGGRPLPMAQVRMDGGELRWVPAEGGAVRGGRASVTPGAATHAAHSGTHTHVHASYSQGGPARHEHMHSHANDADHHHQHNEPGQPGPGMPAVTLGANSADPGGEISGIGVGEAIARFLQAAGRDVAADLRQAHYDAERRAQRARAAVRRAGEVWLELKAARQHLRYVQAAWVARRPGYSIGEINEASARVRGLEGEWQDVTCSDPDLQREIMRNPVR